MLSQVVALRYDAARGALAGAQTYSTLPEGFSGENSGAEIAAHPSSKFLYASNRGHDSIASFRIDAATGSLTPLEHVSTQGKTPRNFAIDPSGRFLIAANQNSGTVVVFRIDQETGRLAPTGSAPVPSPVCLVFAAGRQG
jgi:6-phosphogluconolactonase